MSNEINLRRLFSRENPGVLLGFIKNAEQDAGRPTTVTPTDIVAATEAAVSEMEARSHSKRAKRAKKFITLSIPGRVGDGLRMQVMIDGDGMWFALSAAVSRGSSAAA